MTLGPTAYLAAKAKGDRSMPSKRERSEDADDPVPQGPRDTVRTALFEPQPPTMQPYIPRHSVLRRGHRDRATRMSSLEPSTRWAMGHHPIQGGERGTYVALDHVQHHGNVGSPDAPRGAGRRSRRSTPRTGKPSTWGRAAGVLRPGWRGTRDAKRRNRPGDHPHCGGHWRAGCSERRTPGSGRGGWKSAHGVTRQPPTPPRPLLRSVEQAHRSALAHHVHRTARLGASVLINGTWY